MAARKWTDEQRQRQAAAIRTWAPWAKSTGPRTPAGKAVASKNAVNYACRELLREMARQNRALIAFINGMGPAPSYDRTAMDGLLSKVETAVIQNELKPAAELVSAPPPKPSAAADGGSTRQKGARKQFT